MLVTLVLGSAACTSGEVERPRTSEPVVEKVDGMRYYVGGPIMKSDRYGRLRLGGFNGEVSSPTTRGLLIGIKVDDSENFDYRTWLNGQAVSSSVGFLDDDGLLWYTKRFTYDSNGNVIARQELEYNDDRKVMISLLEHVDPETGETVRSHREEMPYTPLDDDDDDDDEDEASGETSG